MAVVAAPSALAYADGDVMPFMVGVVQARPRLESARRPVFRPFRKFKLTNPNEVKTALSTLSLVY